jgi:hypothetical protein
MKNLKLGITALALHLPLLLSLRLLQSVVNGVGAHREPFAQ